MVIKITRILLLVIAIIVAAIYLPHFYWMIFDINIRTPYVMYSAVTDDFMFYRYRNQELFYVDKQGKEYSRDQFEELLPLQNYRQLSSSGKMPDSLRGQKIDIRDVRDNNITYRVTPEDFDNLQIQLYPLFESQSGRVRLEMPREFFRIARRMEFIDADKNEVNEEMSARFTSALTAQGFQFPAKLISGNPNPKKAFDEGYFVVDAGNAVFHLKQVKGEPFCVKTAIPSDIPIAAIVMREFSLREFYGLLFTQANDVYLISYENYQLIKLPIEGYNREADVFTLSADLFFRVMTLRSDSEIRAFVTDRDYKIINTYSETWKTKFQMTRGIVASYLFPFSIELTAAKSKLVNLYFHFSSWHYFLGNLFFFVLAIGLLLWKKSPVSNNIFELTVILVTGVYGLVAVLIFEKVGKTI
ncbi:MAG: DUF4857 domain-containing protein [Candidatus Zhuqueibacterota bacterium]